MKEEQTLRVRRLSSSLHTLHDMLRNIRTRPRLRFAFLGRDSGTGRSQEDRTESFGKVRPNTHNSSTSAHAESTCTRPHHSHKCQSRASATKRKLLVTFHGRTTLAISWSRQELLSPLQATLPLLDLIEAFHVQLSNHISLHRRSYNSPMHSARRHTTPHSGVAQLREHNCSNTHPIETPRFFFLSESYIKSPVGY
jgi:hypothetical protein